MKVSDDEVVRIGKALYESNLVFQCEAPNNNMHNFNGRAVLKKEFDIKVVD